MRLAEGRIVPGRALWLAGLTGVGFFILGYGGLLLSSRGHMIALIWPANAFAACMLLRLSRSRIEDSLMLAATAVAEILINAVSGASLVLTIGFVAASLVQVAGAVIAARKFGPRRFKNIPSGLLFIATAILLPALLGAAMGGIVMRQANNPNWISDTQHWFAANVLGFCIVFPIGLAITSRRLGRLLLK